MKPIYLLAIIALLSLSFGFPANKNPNNTTYYSIEKLIDSGIIDTKISALGGHTGNSIQFEITNLSSDTQFIEIEKGRRLLSIDTSTQDMLILKPILFVLLPNSKTTTTGFAFCCQSSNSSPHKSEEFEIGNVNNPLFTKLADLLEKDSFSNSVIQDAVWAISNGHVLAGIDSYLDSKNLELKRGVSLLLGRELPWYSIFYEQKSDRVFSNIPISVKAKIELYLKHNTSIDCVVRNDQGLIERTLLSNSYQPTGKLPLNLEMNVKGWKKGKYTVEIYKEQNNLLWKNSFEL